MGAKSFIGTQETQRQKIQKLVCTMKKCMVSMATVNVILEHGGMTLTKNYKASLVCKLRLLRTVYVKKVKTMCFGNYCSLTLY